MAQGNVELVQRSFEHWAEGDLDAMAKAFHPDLVVHPPSGWPEGGAVEGVHAWVRQAERLRDSWEDAAVEFDEIRSVGDDRVYARIRYVTHSESGMEFDTPMAVAIFLREGRIARAKYFWEPVEARAAVGLDA